jgi:hypothetical protein
MKSKKQQKPALILRTCNSDMTSCAQRLVNGQAVWSEPFVWKEGEILVAEDYDPSPICGGGLHGLLNGFGDWSLLDWGVNAKAILFEPVECDWVDIGGDKVKVQKAKIVEIGKLPALLAKTFITQIVLETQQTKAGWSKKSTDNNEDSAQIGSSGDSAKIGSSGDYAKIGSSGHSAKIGSSGYSAKIGSSGHYAKIGSSGHSAKIGSSGDSAQIGSSGYSAKIEATGIDSVITSAGVNCTGKVGENGALALTYKDKKGRYRIAVGYEGEGLKAGVLYQVNETGEFVEVQE